MMVPYLIAALYCLCGLAVADEIFYKVPSAQRDEGAALFIAYFFIMLVWPVLFIRKGIKTARARRIAIRRARNRV